MQEMLANLGMKPALAESADVGCRSPKLCKAINLVP
jgi:hypothetical protein